MDYDRETMRRRREADKAEKALELEKARIEELKRIARAAKARLKATTNSEIWHRMALGWLDRDAGYTGDMASARLWLRRQSLREYGRLMQPFFENMPHATVIEIEVAAVKANLDEWTARGEALLLDRAKNDYAEEARRFAAWQRDNPDSVAWRRKPATRAQGFLIARMTAALDVSPPSRMTRGEAFDWIARHGGNPRLSQTDAAAQPANQPDGRAGSAAPRQDSNS